MAIIHHNIMLNTITNCITAVTEISALVLDNIKLHYEFFECFNLFKNLIFLRYIIRNNAVKIQQAIADYIIRFRRENFRSNTGHNNMLFLRCRVF